MLDVKCRGGYGISERSQEECIHRGPQVRLEQCILCKGNTQIKVFACSKHGECTIARKLNGVAACGDCRDFTCKSTHREPPVSIVHSRNPSALRVVIPLPGLYTGGVEVWAATLARYADPAKLSLTVASDTCRSTSMLDRLAEHASVLIGSGAIARALSTADIALLWAVPSDGARLDGPPLRVFVSHGCGAWTDSSWQKLNSICQHRAAVSRAAAAVVRGQSCMIIPNGVDLDHLKPTKSREEVRQEWGIKDGEKVLGFVGRLSPEKDPFGAARVAATLGEPWRAVIVGPAYAEECRRQMTRYEAVYPGEMLTANALLGFDVSIISSPAEGASLAALETMAAGVPLVSTRVGNVADIEIDYGPPCEIVPVGASDADLAAAVLRAKRPNLELIRERYNGLVMADRWTEYLSARAASINRDTQSDRCIASTRNVS